jgi:hypothetical protein
MKREAFTIDVLGVEHKHDFDDPSWHDKAFIFYYCSSKIHGKKLEFCVGL